jgi:long-chain acyl-CoA synthetase
LGKKNLDLEKIEAIKATIKPDDLACIIYTSGTTGTPKGVMLMHSNFVNQVMSVHNILGPNDTRALSFLPMCHAYEKMLLYVYQYRGLSIYYAESLATIGDNIKEVNPNIMCCVPRLLEKIYNKLFAAGKKLPYAKQKLYYWAFSLAMKFNIEGNSAWYNAQHKIADKLIYKQLRRAIGGDWDVIVSGSAAIQPSLVSFFSAIGMPIFEGYGLTETSPVIAVSNRNPHGRLAGAVGTPIEGVEVKITERNEIICRGHNVMKGYYKAPDLTAEAIDKDGWFHTGDTGTFTEHGLLKITGRLKSIFKTSMGKYVNPFLLEEKMAQSHFIDSIMVVGENQKFCAALIAPDFMFLKNWAKLHDIKYTTNEEMIKHPRVRSRIGEEIKKYNAEFGDTEKIKKFELVPDEWTVANGLLTPTLKIKREKVAARYKDEIEALFA